MTTTVRVSRKFQLAVPAAARKRLDIHQGDRLLVDIQDGMLILLPEPASYTAALAGLHREVWGEADAQEHVINERGEWGS